LVISPPPQGWPLERDASWRRVRRARAIVAAVYLPGVLLVALVGLRAGISGVGVFVLAAATLIAHHMGATAARAVDARYPMVPAVDPPAEPPPPLKPSLPRAVAAVVVGTLGWSAVAVIVWMGVIPLKGSLAAVLVWAAFIALAAWSLMRAFVAHLHPPEDPPVPAQGPLPGRHQ